MKEAEAFAEARGLSLRDAVVQMKFCDPATAAQALAEELGRPFVDLADVIPDDSVLDVVPRSTVKRYAAFPLFIDEDTVLVACVDEPDPELEEEIRLRFGLPMRAVIATPLVDQPGNRQILRGRHARRGRRRGGAQKGRAARPKNRTAKAKAKSTKKAATVRKRFRDLTPEEQHERKQFGYIIMCWATVGSVLIDQFVLKGRVFPFRHLNFFPVRPVLSDLLHSASSPSGGSSRSTGSKVRTASHFKRPARRCLNCSAIPG